MREKSPLPTQKIAFFSLSKTLSLDEQKQSKLFLWDEYCANGGDPLATPSFHDFGVENGLIWCPTIEEFRAAVMNKSKNPAERTG